MNRIFLSFVDGKKQVKALHFKMKPWWFLLVNHEMRKKILIYTVLESIGIL